MATAVIRCRPPLQSSVAPICHHPWTSLTSFHRLHAAAFLFAYLAPSPHPCSSIGLSLSDHLSSPFFRLPPFDFRPSSPLALVFAFPFFAPLPC